MNGLSLANLKGAAEPDMARLDALRLRIALWPLLEGTVQVESIVLVRPVIDLEVLPDGRRNWAFAGPARAGAAAPPGAAPAPGEPAAAPQIQLDRFAIQDGTIVYRDQKAGRVERVEKVNAEIAAKSLSGPFRGEGRLVARGVPLEVGVNMGRLTEERPTSVAVSLETPSAGAKAQFSGSLSRPSADGKLAGKLHLEGDSLARLIAAVAQAEGTLPGMLAQKVTLDGTVGADATRLGLDEMSVQLGAARATGSLDVAFGPPLAAKVALAANHVDLDEWLALPPSVAAAPQEQTTAAPGRDAGAPGKTAAVPADAKDGFVLPKDVRASLDLTVDALVFRGEVVRQAKLRAGLANGKLSLDQATALLPGGSDVAVFGTLASAKGKPRFDGNVEAVSDNLRAVLAWFGAAPADVPPDRLRKFSFTGKIQGDPGQVSITGVDMRLDASQLTGGVVVALRRRPAFGASFALDRFNLDAYLPAEKAAPAGVERKPLPSKRQGEKKTPEGAPAKGDEAPLAWLEGFDANIKGSIGTLMINRTPVEHIRLDGTLHGGKLTVREAVIGSLAGGSAKVKGTLAGFTARPTLDASFEVRAKDPERLMRLFGVEPPVPAERLGQLSASGSAKGDAESLALDTELSLAGAKVELKGTVAALATPPHFDLSLGAAHPSLIELVRVAVPDYRPAAEDLRGFRLNTRLTGDLGGLTASDIDARIGPVNVAGNAEVKLAGPRPKVTAELATSEILVDLFLPPPERKQAALLRRVAVQPSGAPGGRWSREPLDLSALEAVDADVTVNAAALSYDKYRVVKPDLALGLADGTLAIRRLSGALFDGTVDIKGQVAAAEVPTAQTTLVVRQANIRQALFAAGDVDIADGRLDLDLDLATSGRSQFDLVSALVGKARMAVSDGTVRGFDLSAVSDRLKRIDRPTDLLDLLGRAMSGGTTRFSRLDGTFDVDKGVARTDDLSLVAQAGEGRVRGNVDLPRWQMAMRAEFRLTEHPKAPPFGVRLEGPIDQPRRVFETDRLQAYLVQRGVGTFLKKVLPQQPQQQAPATTAPQQTAPQQAVPQETQPQEPQPEEKKPEPEDVIRDILRSLQR